MPLAFSPSSTASSPATSPSDSPQKENPATRKKLTRLLQFRHAGDDELSSRPAKSLPASPDDGYASGTSRHWSKSAVPQPLPLPELSSLHKNDSPTDHLPSPPREAPTSGDEDRIHSSTTVIPRSNIFQGTRRNSSDDVARRSSRSPTYRRRGFSNELHVEGVGYDFRISVPARSAPSSGFSSPTLSPQRYRTVDPLSVLVQASLALDSSPQDRVNGSPSQALPTRIMCSPDHSPLQSPKLQNPCMSTRKHTATLSHSNQKSHSETWPDGANMHPLPLPPGVSRPSQPPATHQHFDKSDESAVKGQWIKGKLIGRGSYGSVYVATNCKTGALCAMKEVDLITDDPKAMECIKQLEQEIKVLRKLKHRNIVQYLGTETIEDHFCIYLEYVHPGSINKYVNEHCGAMTESVVRSFTRHIASGLAYLHSKKTIHRDIKGANLLVDANGVVKLADFGLAKHLTGHATALSLKGSPHWMAPEVLQAAVRKDTTSEIACGIDIWGLGCTVIEMLTGKPPWSDFSGVQAMFNVLSKSPPIPDTLSPEGKDFLQRCLQRRPADRPSAAMLLEHPFLRNSYDQNVASCSKELSGVTLLDKQGTPKDGAKRKKDLMSFLPNISTKSRKPTQHSETRQIGAKASDSGSTSRHSPRSTLESLPSMSSPELNGSSNNATIPSNNVFKHLARGSRDQEGAF